MEAPVETTSVRDAPASAGGHVTFGSLFAGSKNNLDFTRFFLASAVIYHHSYPLLLGEAARDGLGSVTRAQTDAGGLAVGLFFLISGFLVTASWEKSAGPLDYLRKRVLRIYPGFVAVILFCILFVGPLSRMSLSHYFTNPHTYLFAKPLTLANIHDKLPGAFEHNPYPHAVDGSLWTIRYEFFCYLLVAALGLAGAVRNRAFTLALLVAAAAAYLYERHGWASVPVLGLVPLWLRMVVYYLAGMSLYLYRDRIPYSRGLALASVLATVVSIPLGLFEPLMPLAGSYAVLYFALHPGLAIQNFGRRGDFSYGMYLYGFPVQQLLVQYLGAAFTPLTLMAAALPVTLILAMMSWHLVEKPFLRLKRNRRPQAAVEAEREPALTAVP